MKYILISLLFISSFCNAQLHDEGIEKIGDTSYYNHHDNMPHGNDFMYLGDDTAHKFYIGEPVTKEYLKTHKLYTAVRRYDTIYIPKGYTLYNDTIAPKKDNSKLYYHKFLYFNKLLNNPRISRKKFDMYEDSCKKYLDLLYKPKTK